MSEDSKLSNAARRLGVQAAERLDVERVATAVVKGLRRKAWIQPAWLRIAAALVVLVGGGVLASRLTPGRRPGVSPAHGAHLVTDDLTDLTADQLRDVLNTLDETLNVRSTTLPDGDLEDLDTQQLQAVLRTLEG